jgi:hypothetical protein
MVSAPLNTHGSATFEREESKMSFERRFRAFVEIHSPPSRSLEILPFQKSPALERGRLARPKMQIPAALFVEP